MLKSINIENIAIIEKVSIDFSKGLNILTGETGAGKSIIIDTINAVIGEKTSRELIRTGENSASVSALFTDISPEIVVRLEENALPVEKDRTLLLQRKLFRDGKNICRINGASVTVSLLKSIGTNLINIHGQRDSQTLIDASKHLMLFDSFAGTEKLREDYKRLYEKLRAIKAQIESLRVNETYRERRTDILTYQINELSEAEIKSGEREELYKKKTILTNSAKIINALKTALSFLSGDDTAAGACAMINSALSEIASVSSLAKGLDALTDTLGNAASVIDDAASLIDDVLVQLNSINGNLEQTEERLDLLYRLSKKYGETEEEMLSFLNNAQAELDSLSSAEEKLKALEEEYNEILKKTVNMAEKLSQKRKDAQSLFSSAVQYELSFLDMSSCKFVVSLTDVDMNENGSDAAEFLVSANVGEEPKPLNKVASGGELSRIMLAVNNVLSGDGEADTLIFDEIDSGVSGFAARRIAIKLAEISKHTQTLLITHLAQIAAFADEHKYLYKEVIDGKTFTRIKTLSFSERPYELARMAYGGKAEKVHIDAAKHMIANANETKQN